MHHATPRHVELPDDVDPIPPDQSFIDEARSIGIAFDPGDLEQLARFVGLLLHTNTLINLTAIRDPHLAWRRHILDALTLLPILDELHPTPEAPNTEQHPCIADVGSGGGLPVVPLAIVLPRFHFTAIEATSKKVRFIELAAERLGLDNLTVLNERAETIGRDPAFRESFHVVTARAVGKLAVVAELTVPLATTAGRVLLVKGERAEGELAEAKHALHLLHARHERTIPTPTGRIVILTKSKSVPNAYPRRDGEPKRAPLAG